MREGWSVRLGFGLACAVVLATEAFVLFADRVDVVRTEGRQPFEISEFARGRPVSHAFLMLNDGLQSVSVRFSSAAAATVRVEWQVFRGERNRYLTQPGTLLLAFEGVTSVDLRPGRQWKTLAFTRDGSSAGRWYKIQLRLPDAGTSPTPQVSLVASHDNPERGGVLWIDDARQTGSLFLRAERHDRTLYRRFLMDAVPNFPEPLRTPVAQWSIAAALHWAAVVVAYALFTDGRRASVVRRGHGE